MRVPFGYPIGKRETPKKEGDSETKTVYNKVCLGLEMGYIGRVLTVWVAVWGMWWIYAGGADSGLICPLHLMEMDNSEKIAGQKGSEIKESIVADSTNMGY